MASARVRASATGNLDDFVVDPDGLSAGFNTDTSFEPSGSESESDSDSGDDRGSVGGSSESDSDSEHSTDSFPFDDLSTGSRRGKKTGGKGNGKGSGKKAGGKGGSDVDDINRLTAELGGDPGDGRSAIERRASADIDDIVDDIQSRAGKAKADAKRKGKGAKSGGGGGGKKKTKTKTKRGGKSRSTSRMSRDDRPDVLREGMREEELKLLESIMAESADDDDGDDDGGAQADGGASKSKLRRSRRERRPPRRYENRRDVRKSIVKHYTKKTKPDRLNAYIKMLEEDVASDPLMQKYMDEADQFSSDEGYNTEEERLGRKLTKEETAAEKVRWAALKAKKKKTKGKQGAAKKGSRATTAAAPTAKAAHSDSDDSGSGSGSDSDSGSFFSSDDGGQFDDGASQSSVDSRGGSPAAKRFHLGN